MDKTFPPIHDDKWMSSDVPLITTVIIPSTTGLHIGIVDREGIHLITLPDAIFTANMHLDSKELFDCVISSLQECKLNVAFNVGEHKVPLSSWGSSHSKAREFVFVKENVKSYSWYMMVQVLHFQVIEIENIGARDVCFAFHVMTNYSGEGFIVQKNTRVNEDYVPMEGYELGSIPVVCHTHEFVHDVMQHIYVRTNSGMDRLAGLEQFVIMPLTERNMAILATVSEHTHGEESIGHSTKDCAQEQNDTTLQAVFDRNGPSDGATESDTVPDLPIERDSSNGTPSLFQVENDMDSSLENSAPFLLGEWGSVGQCLNCHNDGATQLPLQPDSSNENAIARWFDGWDNVGEGVTLQTDDGAHYDRVLDVAMQPDPGNPNLSLFQEEDDSNNMCSLFEDCSELVDFSWENYEDEMEMLLDKANSFLE